MSMLAVRGHAATRASGSTSSVSRRALVAWGAIVVAGISTALAVRAGGARISIDAPPFHGRIDPTLGAAIAVPIVVAVVIVRRSASRR